MKTYTARAKRWEHGWELHLDGQFRERNTGQISPLITQLHSSADARRMLADVIETWTGERAGSFAVEITFRFDPDDPDEPDALVERIERLEFRNRGSRRSARPRSTRPKCAYRFDPRATQEPRPRVARPSG